VLFRPGREPAVAFFKTGHYEDQNRPIGLETGQYPKFLLEHIANIEQIVYSAALAKSQRAMGVCRRVRFGRVGLKWPLNRTETGKKRR
jgi:hypothetical protein